MSKYIVIYNYTYTKSLAHPPMKDWVTPPTKEESFNGVGIKEFDTYEEAFRFSIEKHGFVLKPIEPKVIEEEQS